MKRWWILLLVLMLAAPCALAETFTAENAFSFEYPDGWTADYQDVADNTDEEEGVYCFGSLNGDELVLDVYLSDYRDDYGDMSLYSATEAQARAYRRDLLEAFGDSQCEFVGEYRDNVYGIPFYVLRVNDDEDGEYYYADTISGGWCVCLYFYCEYDDDALTQRELDVLTEILDSFEPAL